MNIKKYFFKKTVIITGHTGFKGSWLTLWLYLSGAKIIGLSIDEPSRPSHFNLLNLKKKIKSIKIDVRNLSKLQKVFIKYQPDFVFHLAAQSIVKKSYMDPIFTYETNALGTLNILESLKSVKKSCVALFITSDKTYKNFEKKAGYKEDEILGGNDLYSSSKASADILINSYVKSFFLKKKNIIIGIARAGNVIGGGDWSQYRLIPDCVKAWSKKKKNNYLFASTNANSSLSCPQNILLLTTNEGAPKIPFLNASSVFSFKEFFIFCVDNLNKKVFGLIFKFFNIFSIIE